MKRGHFGFRSESGDLDPNLKSAGFQNEDEREGQASVSTLDYSQRASERTYWKRRFEVGAFNSESPCSLLLVSAGLQTLRATSICQ